jgi:hypothetical protein
MSAEYCGWQPEHPEQLHPIKLNLGFDLLPQVRRQRQEAWLRSSEAKGHYYAQQYYSLSRGGELTYFFSDESTAQRFQAMFGGQSNSLVNHSDKSPGTVQVNTD